MGTETKRRLTPLLEARHQLGGIGHTTIYDLIAKGELQKVNLGRRSFIVTESLDALVDRLSEAATA
jgi:predicted DNA-binding transcriptional regulator AlpA